MKAARSLHVFTNLKQRAVTEIKTYFLKFHLKIAEAQKQTWDKTFVVDETFLVAAEIGDETFDIDPDGGELLLTRLLDYETDDVTQYLLRVSATDQGDPPRKT